MPCPDFGEGNETARAHHTSRRRRGVLAYNLTRVMNIMGIQPLMAAIRA